MALPNGFLGWMGSASGGCLTGASIYGNASQQTLTDEYQRGQAAMMQGAGAIASTSKSPHFPRGHFIDMASFQDMQRNAPALAARIERDTDAGWARADWQRDGVVYEGPAWATLTNNTTKAAMDALDKTTSQQHEFNPLLLLTGDQS